MAHGYAKGSVGKSKSERAAEERFRRRTIENQPKIQIIGRTKKRNKRKQSKKG